MDFLGLIKKYPTPRRLLAQERTHQLHQKRRLNVEPHYQLSVIKMNSTFLESVDKWFAWKGVVSAFAIANFSIFAGATIFISTVWMIEALASGTSSEDMRFWLANSTGMAILGALLGWGTIWLLHKESFRHTHYPIRFNRKKRTVYVFRTDGTVLSVPWDRVFFTLGHLAMWNEWEVRGHVLESDKETVRETFALSYVGSLGTKDVAPETNQYSSQDFVRAHWEFVRRYMEEGPQAVLGKIQFCMPVDRRRERFIVGAERVFANFTGASFLIYWMMSPFCLIVSTFRWFAMRTSKVPLWPQDVEANCEVEPNDQYAIEGAPDGKRVAVFPEAALAAGVCFCTPAITSTRVGKKVDDFTGKADEFTWEFSKSDEQ